MRGWGPRPPAQLKIVRDYRRRLIRPAPAAETTPEEPGFGLRGSLQNMLTQGDPCPSRASDEGTEDGKSRQRKRRQKAGPNGIFRIEKYNNQNLKLTARV